MAPKQKIKTPRRIIFAGANIAFGVSYIGLELLGLLYGVSPANPDLQANLNLVIVGMNLLGGYAGGYLTAKNHRGDALQQGTLIGVLAYIIQQIVFATLYGWGVVGNGFTTLALIGGSMAGALLYESQMKKLVRIRSVASQTKEEYSHGDTEGREAGSEEGDEEYPGEKGKVLPEG
jgi:hypothetical protein